MTEKQIPNDYDFCKMRKSWREEIANSHHLRSKAIELTILSDQFKFGYQWEWMGVPIIRHPDDIVLQQEIIWSLKPSHVIETGVARGGSLLLSWSLLQICSGGGKVLGLDIKILDHTFEKLKHFLDSGQIIIHEVDSISIEAKRLIKKFLIDSTKPILLVLDSDHTHDHVLAELNLFAPLLPVGSIVIVADTIVEDMPQDYYVDRKWGIGNNPLTALNSFLNANKNFILDKRWSRRGILTEFRDGIIVKTSD